MGRTGQQMRARTKKAISSSSNSGRAPRAVKSGGGARLRYAFDNSMSRGTSALVGWLAVATIGLIVLFALVSTLFNLREENDEGFRKELFQSLVHALDPGTVAGDDGTWRFLLTMLVLTVAGLFIVSALIGVISAGIDDKLAELRRGRSAVLETGHTVILGWSEAVFTIISELTIANESRRKPVVVVLADRDKVAMDEEIRNKLPDLRGTKVVCRTGSPIDMGDLELCSHQEARSIIVLSPEGTEPDSEVIKTLLALTHAEDSRTPIVAEIQDPQNLEAARMVGRGRAVIVDKRETVSRLIVQTSRQSGAAAVYTELFDFDGSEIYFHETHELRGSTFSDARLAYEQATVIGLLGRDGEARLNPDGTTVIEDEALIVVAEDDQVLGSLTESTAGVDASRFSVGGGPGTRPTKTLLIGWNDGAPTVVRELDAYAAQGSSLTILTEFGNPFPPDLNNIKVTLERGRTTERSVLAQHLEGGVDHVIVLCYSGQLSAQQADARTLITLLHVRELAGEGPGSPSVVSELIDDRNRALAEVAHVDDVIVSDQILSLMLTQLAEDSRLAPIFVELLRPDSSEIYLRPAEWYVHGDGVNFATIVAAAARRGETALGYRAAETVGSEDNPSGVLVNPVKSKQFSVQPGDRVVVLAEN